MARLTMIMTDGQSVTFRLEGELTRLGRSSGCEIVLEHRSISRHHAEISQPRKGRFLVRDCGSKNGTWLNGVLVSDETLLGDGDRLLLGENELLFNDDRSAAVPKKSGKGKKDKKTIPLPKSRPGRPSDEALASGSTMVVPLEDILGPRTPASTKPVPGEAGKAGGEPSGSVWRSTDRLITVINRTARALISNRPMDELSELVLDLVFDSLPVQRGILMLLEKMVWTTSGMIDSSVSDSDEKAADHQLTGIPSNSGEPADYLREVASRRRIAERDETVFTPSRTILERVIREQVSVMTQDATTDSRFDAAESVMLQGIRSVMCVPLWSDAAVIGAMYVDTLNPRHRFSREDLELLTFMANLAAVKIENARLLEESLEKKRLEEELALAAAIQQRLLPSSDPQIEGYRIHGLTIPCRGVGGDYYDFISRSDGLFNITVGDVAGKGMGASLLMSSLQACLSVLTAGDMGLDGLVSRLNDHFCRHSAGNKFITLFLAELDSGCHRIRYCNAGHNLPFLVRAEGEVLRLDRGGAVLGVIPGTDYAIGEQKLEPGDMILLFSDGVTEATDLGGVEYGENRLGVFLRRHRRDDPVPLIERLMRELDQYRGPGRPREDDLTLVAVRRGSS